MAQPSEKKMFVRKRDGSMQAFDVKKIERALLGAFNDARPHDQLPNLRELANRAASSIATDAPYGRPDGSAGFMIEDIHKFVIATLEREYPDVAKAYADYKARRDAIRDERLRPDPAAVANYIHASKYARQKADGKLETFDETVNRVEAMHVRKFAGPIGAVLSGAQDALANEIYDAFDLVRQKKVLPAMRSMQFGGAAIERNNCRMYNCLSRDTEFVTEHGVRTFADFKSGDRVRVLTHKGRFKDAVVKSYGRQRLCRIELARGRSKKVVKATANHRWLKHDNEETTSLKPGDRIMCAPAHDFNPAILVEENLREWCLGFALGDGHYMNGKLVVRLCGRKSELAPMFEEAGYEVREWNSFDGDLVVFMEGEQKIIPDGAGQPFLEGLIAADGDAEGKTLSTSNPLVADWVRQHAPCVGRYVLSEQVITADTNFGPRSSPLHKFTFMTHSTDPAYVAWTVRGVDSLDADEVVWCLEVEDDRSFVLPFGAVTGNCAFTYVNRLRVFGEIFHALLSGCGVGFSVQTHHVDGLPELVRIDHRQVWHHEVADSIEGWADAVNALVAAHFAEGHHVEFSYMKIRPEGSPLSTGGFAPGHLPLKECLERLRAMFNKAAGRKLRPIEAHDAVCFIADAVLSGGIRRSSLISLFSPDDTEMLYAKAHGNFRPARGDDPGTNAQRGMANNSAVLLRRTVTRDQFDRVLRISREWGEPGFFFTDNLEYGINPCGEIGLHPHLQGSGIDVDDSTIDFDPAELVVDSNPFDEIKRYGSASGFQFCNLCEVNVAACKTVEEFMDAVEAAAFIGTLQAAYTKFDYLGPVTEMIARQEALLGVGLTGIMDNPEIGLNPRLLKEAARRAVDENRRVAKIIGINPAARVTTVKPSGTASLALGCVGSGIHPHHARRYLRRVTANPNETVAKLFAATNPHMVEDKPNGDKALVFPVQAPDAAVTKADVKAVDFIEKVMTVFDNWIATGSNTKANKLNLTHNVSCTVQVEDGAWESVASKVWNERDRIAAMSFVPAGIGKKYPHAPLEEIETRTDEARWNELISGYSPVDYSAGLASKPTSDPACAGGSCEI